MKFKTTLSKWGEFNIYNWPKEYNKRDMDLNSGEVDIEWEMEIESRKWGIKYFVFPVNKITGYLHAYDIDTDEEFELDLGDYKFKVIENTDMISFFEHIAPKELAIDFKKKIIEVEF